MSPRIPERMTAILARVHDAMLRAEEVGRAAVDDRPTSSRMRGGVARALRVVARRLGLESKSFWRSAFRRGRGERARTRGRRARVVIDPDQRSPGPESGPEPALKHACPIGHVVD